MAPHQTSWSREDRDLLVELRTKVEGLSSDIKEMKDSTLARVIALESTAVTLIDAERLQKVADKLHDDHELRLRRLERWGSMAIGALALIQFLVEVALK